MLWLALSGLVLLTLGSVFSILRSSSTVEYYRTMLKDGRDDSEAKRFMAGYYFGLAAVGAGVLLLAAAAASV